MHIAVPIHPRYLPRLITRALLLWLGTRLLVSGIAAGARVPALVLATPALVLLVVMVSVVAHVDARVMRERIFHANLGSAPWAPAAVAALFAILAEAVITAAARALA